MRYPNFAEQIKQWTNVHGVSQTPTQTDTPQSGWTRTRYGSTGTTAPVEAISLQGVGHNLPMGGMAAMAIAFFGLNTSVPPDPDPDPPTGGPCRVDYAVNAWNTGLTTAVTITATGTTPINGWSLVFTLPGGQTITGGWNASYSPNSGQITARPVTHNSTINPSGTAGFGFQATHTGNTGEPTSFTLNGNACTVA